MAPAFIADSDDESEGNTFSPPPAAQAEDDPSFASTRSEPASLATSSTDPHFFQGIYKEQQIAAAREQRLRDGDGDIGSFQLTAPTGTEQTDPVLLPSQYPEGKSLAVGDRNRGNTSHAVKSVIMKGKRMRQDMAGAIDPYAFPSSAEEDQRVGGPQAGWVPTTDLTYCGNSNTGIEEEEKMGPPSRKKQRLSGRANDGVDSSLPPTAPPIYSSIPPTMPPGDLGETAVVNNANDPGILAPAMSTGEDSSLIINPTGLSSSQKEQYVALELLRSSDPERQREHEDALPQLPTDSSAQSQRQRTPSKRSSPSTSRTTRQRRGKSQPGGYIAASIQLGTPEQTQENHSTKVLLNSDDEEYEMNGTRAAKETKVEDDVYEIPPSRVKPAKKKRGRPKKAGKETQEAVAMQLETTEGIKPEKVARKRGRPKKSESVVEEEAEQLTEINLDDAPAQVAEEDEAKDEARDAGDAQNVTVFQHVTVDNESALETPSVAAKETPQKRAGKRTSTPQTGSAGKPPYRIGLSKRSRIAPLLKSLPK